MTSTAERPTEITVKRDNPVKVSIASMIGTAVESYDFFIYGTAAAAYFGTAFFAADTAFIGILASFATLAIGFLFRPLGGYLAGHYGDRLGRKTVLIAALSVMGVATFLIGVLPTYATVGVLAPVLLIVLRAVQGIGYGAEWGGAVLMAVEHAPASRRGFFGSIPQIGIPAGLLLANGTFLVSAWLFEGDWVWRVPFLLSVVMVAIGLWIRLGITESPDFEKMKAAGEIYKRPAVEVLKRDWRYVVRIIALRLAETGGYYITTSFVLSYVVLGEHHRQAVRALRHDHRLRARPRLAPALRRAERPRGPQVDLPHRLDLHHPVRVPDVLPHQHRRRRHGDRRRRDQPPVQPRPDLRRRGLVVLRAVRPQRAELRHLARLQRRLDRRRPPALRRHGGVRLGRLDGTCAHPHVARRDLHDRRPHHEGDGTDQDRRSSG